MYNLFILDEILTNSFNSIVLNIVSVFSILSGVLVIISKNPVVSVLFLIGLFLTVASYLMILGINFIGLSYLLVYVGAVSILFLFILMLINVRVSELAVSTSNSIPLAIMIGLLFNTTLGKTFPYQSAYEYSIAQQYSVYLSPKQLVHNFYDIFNNSLNFVTSQIWDGKLAEVSHITSIGNIIYTNFPIWLILTSIILLLAMVGSILITIKQ